MADDMKKTTPRSIVTEEFINKKRGKSQDPTAPKSPNKKVSIPPLPVHMIRRDNG